MRAGNDAALTPQGSAACVVRCGQRQEAHCESARFPGLGTRPALHAREAGRVLGHDMQRGCPKTLV